MSVNNTVLDELIDALTERMSKSFSKNLNTANVEYAYSGIVMEIDSTNDTAIVDIGDSITEFIPNKTGFAVGEATDGESANNSILKVGDTVKVFSDRKNMAGAYIGVKIS